MIGHQLLNNNKNTTIFKFKKFRELNRPLTRLEFGGFMAVEKHVQFVRAVMDYASSLETILLEDKDHCGYCDEVSSNLAYSSIGSMFPKNKRNQEFPKNKRKRHDAEAASALEFSCSL